MYTEKISAMVRLQIQEGVYKVKHVSLFNITSVFINENELA